MMLLPVGIYLFKVTCYILYVRSGVLTVNFEYISHIPGISIADFEQVNFGWVTAKNCQIL